MFDRLIHVASEQDVGLLTKLRFPRLYVQQQKDKIRKTISSALDAKQSMSAIKQGKRRYQEFVYVSTRGLGNAGRSYRRSSKAWALGMTCIMCWSVSSTGRCFRFFRLQRHIRARPQNCNLRPLPFPLPYTLFLAIPCPYHARTTTRSAW